MMLSESKHISLAHKTSSETIRELYVSHPPINPEYWSSDVRSDPRVARLATLPERFSALLERTSVGVEYLKGLATYLKESKSPSPFLNSDWCFSEIQLNHRTESTNKFRDEFWAVINDLRNTISTRDSFPRIFREAELVVDIRNGIFLEGPSRVPWWRTVVSGDSIRAEEAYRKLSSYRKHQADFGVQVLISEILAEYGVDISGRLFPQ